MTVKMAPLGDRVLVKQDEGSQKTKGGLYLPETAKEAPQFGVVARVGPGRMLENGQIRELPLKEGDKVVFSKYSGTKVNIDTDEYLFLREEDILGVLEG